MFCPKCGSTQEEGLRFCKVCGAHLAAVKQALATPDRGEKAELDRLKGTTPDSRRRNEIKAGMITGSIGLGLMIFLYIFMQGLILSGQTSPGDAEILSRLWIVGIIPMLVGGALIINGFYVSKLFGGARTPVEELDTTTPTPTTGELPANDPEYLGPANTTRFPATPFSVTDETTRHLVKEPANQRKREE
ncbi:MAG TPA: hypothetical protein PLR83_07570 [Pyrinomonadaceae bacterium]|nr:hypothetical protein [Pyrinomonadaceae bacterium]